MIEIFVLMLSPDLKFLAGIALGKGYNDLNIYDTVKYEFILIHKN